MINLKRRVSEEESRMRGSHQHGEKAFVAFSCERDSVGRLIKAPSQRERTKKTETASMLSNNKEEETHLETIISQYFKKKQKEKVSDQPRTQGKKTIIQMMAAPHPKPVRPRTITEVSEAQPSPLLQTFYSKHSLKMTQTSNEGFTKSETRRRTVKKSASLCIKRRKSTSQSPQKPPPPPVAPGPLISAVKYVPPSQVPLDKCPEIAEYRRKKAMYGVRVFEDFEGKHEKMIKMLKTSEDKLMKMGKELKLIDGLII